MRVRLKKPTVKGIRDVVMFLIGAYGFINEIISHGPVERPTLLILCAGLMGVPIFLRADEARQVTPPTVAPPVIVPVPEPPEVQQP